MIIMCIDGCTKKWIWFMFVKKKFEILESRLQYKSSFALKTTQI